MRHRSRCHLDGSAIWRACRLLYAVWSLLTVWGVSALPRPDQRRSLATPLREFLVKHTPQIPSIEDVMRDYNLSIPTFTREYCQVLRFLGCELIVETVWSTKGAQQQNTTVVAGRGLSFHFEFNGASLLKTSTPYRVVCKVKIRRFHGNKETNEDSLFENPGIMSLLAT